MKRWAMVCILLLAMPAMAGNAQNIGVSTGHFTITYCNGSARPTDNATFLTALEGAYNDVNGYFGSCPSHVDVIIMDDKDMDSVGKQLDSLSAWNQLMSAIIFRQGTLGNRTVFPILARHELTHLAINEILCKKDPREFQWMEEGICTFVSKEPLDDVDMSKYIVSHGFLNTSEIYGAVKNENCNISKNGYMHSDSLVKYIINRYGMRAFIDMLECPDASFTQAFRHCTGDDFATLYREWENHVKASASE